VRPKISEAVGGTVAGGTIVFPASDLRPDAARFACVSGIPHLAHVLPKRVVMDAPTQVSQWRKALGGIDRRTIPYEEVSERAYTLHTRRCGGGDPVQDWLEAERQLTLEKLKTSIR